MYKIRLSNKVVKYLELLPKKDFLKIDTAILSLKINPRPIGIKKLVDIDGYRIRVGNYRILFTIDDDIKIVSIYKVAPRKDAYRK
jgi:mRNA interferase RelE/StbE